LTDKRIAEILQAVSSLTASTEPMKKSP
jgi:hypothetical protein